VLRDVKVAIRHLLKSPGFSAMAVLMLTLGIGATTAIFSIVEGVLLRPLPFPNPNELVVISDTIKGAEIAGNDEAGVTTTDVVNYTRDTQSFTALGGYQLNGHELSGLGDPAQINDARMTPGVFAALGVQPLLGRVFTAEEDANSVPVAVLSYATWQSRFHGDAQILGRKSSSTANPTSSSGSCRAASSFRLFPAI
jgi:MacB-like periplasmic core domain